MEDLIYPTLAYANELGQQISDHAYANELGLQQIPDFAEKAGLLVSAKTGPDWEAAVERFVERHSRNHPRADHRRWSGDPAVAPGGWARALTTRKRKGRPRRRSRFGYASMTGC